MSPSRGALPSRVLAILAALVAAATALPVGFASGVPSPPPASPLAVLVLQPDAAAGNDTSVVSATPAWNYGTNESLWAGFDSANASVTRSLLRFDLAGLPVTATVVNATLELYAFRGGADVVDVRRAVAPWTEGVGGRSWTRIPVVVTETAGVARTREPVEIRIPFGPNPIGDPTRDLLVWDGGVLIPSQVSRYAYAGPQITSAWVTFGATVAAYEAKTFDVTYGANGTSVPAYRTKTWGSTPLWTYGPTGTGASSVSVADIDGDARLDVVFGGADGFVYALNETLGFKWRTQVAAGRSVPYTPQIADVDGDGALDIVVVTNDPSVVRLNRTGGVLWTRAYALSQISFSTPVLLDVDDNGVLDVLVGGRTRTVEALNGTDGTDLWSYPAADWVYSPSLADINADGRAEIFFSSDDQLVHAFDRQGTTDLWANADPTTQFPEISVALGDLDGDGIREAVTADDQTTGMVFALRSTDGTLEWSVGLPATAWREGGLTLADLDGDGIREVLIGVESGELYALRGTDGQRLWESASGSFQPLYPAVVDVTNDGMPEVVFAEEGRSGASAVFVMNRTGAILHRWNTTQNDPGLRTLSQFHMTTPAVVDLDGDGTLEVIVPTANGIEAFATGGLARDWRTWGYNWNHTHVAWDGNSPDGAPFLVASLGTPTSYPAAGASWNYRDGAVGWASAGGDFGTPESTAAGGVGWAAWNVTAMVREWHVGSFPNVGLFVMAADEAAGTTHAYFSSDATDPARRPRLTITYSTPSVDPLPRITGAIPDMARVEDSPPWSINLAGFAADGDTPTNELRWNVSGYDPGILAITGLNTPGNHIVTFYPKTDAWGNMRVTYWLSDPPGNFAMQRAWINVTPVNDAPAFTPPPTFVVRYNSTYTFNFGPYISDVDDPSSALRLSSDDPVGAAVSGLNVSFRYPQSYLDQWVFVTLAVSDGRASTTRVVAVKVTEDNPPLVSQPLPDVVLREGELRRGVFDLDDYFVDPDNEVLYFSEGYSHLNITIHSNHSVDILADAEWSGWEQVTFRAEDPRGAIAEDTILVTVLPEDDPPILGPVPDLRVRFDVSYLFNLEPYLSDPDTPLDQIGVSTSSPFIGVSLHLLTLLYPAAFNNTVENVTIWASDGTTTVSRVIRVTVGDDWPPFLRSKLPDFAFPEDTVRRSVYNLSAFFGDPDSAQLFYSSGHRNVTVSIDAWGSVDLSAQRDWFGAERVTFRAVDDFGALAEDTVWNSVQPVNDAPFFRTAIPAQVLNATAVYLDLSLYLGDVDNPISDLTLSTTSPRATVVGQGLLLTFPQDGTEDVEVRVSDGQASNQTVISVQAILPTIAAPVPPYVYWIPFLAAGVVFVAFVLYRRRQIEWAFLVTNHGLLVCSMSRGETAALDTDLMTGMLTAILDFARISFSDETERNLEGLTLGDRKVAIVRGEVTYLAVVYSGRTPGSLIRIMQSLLSAIEARHRSALGDIIDTSELGGIPALLQRLVKRGWWPFLRFDDGTPRPGVAGGKPA